MRQAGSKGLVPCRVRFRFLNTAQMRLGLERTNRYPGILSLAWSLTIE
jgi:hypothetical protein